MSSLPSELNPVHANSSIFSSCSAPKTLKKTFILELDLTLAANLTSNDVDEFSNVIALVQ